MTPRSLARALSLLILVALVARPAAAQAAPLGPGPFSAVHITSKSLTFDIDKSAASAAVFSGAPQVSVVVGGSPAAFSSPGKVKKAGARLKQSGTAGGMTIDQLFPEGQQRHVTIRNGNGATTEMDVTRRGSALAVDAITRQPGGGGSSLPAVPYTATAQVQGHSDSTTDLRLQAPAGLDVTVDLSLPALPAGAQSLTVTLVATGTGAGAQSLPVVVSGPSAATHLLLPAGSYGLSAQISAVVGTLETSQLTIGRTVDLGSQIAVSDGARRFAATVPALAIPALQASTVSVSGANQFVPPAGGRNGVLVALVSASGEAGVSYAVAAMRDLDASGSASVAIQAPAGSYAGSVSVLPVGVETIATSYHVASLVLQSVALPGTVNAAMPAVSAVPSSIQDPNHILPAYDAAHPGTITHVVALVSVLGAGTQIFSSAAVVLDPTSDFTLYYAAGATVATVAPVLDLDGSQLDGPGLESETLSFSPGLFFVSPPARIDVVVPALPPFVTLGGRVLDPASNPAGAALVTALSAQVDGVQGGVVTALYRTGADGRFSIDAPQAPTYTLDAFWAPTGVAGKRASGSPLPAALERLLRGVALGR